MQFIKGAGLDDVIVELRRTVGRGRPQTAARSATRSHGEESQASDVVQLSKMVLNGRPDRLQESGDSADLPEASTPANGYGDIPAPGQEPAAADQETAGGRRLGHGRHGTGLPAFSDTSWTRVLAERRKDRPPGGRRAPLCPWPARAAPRRQAG